MATDRIDDITAIKAELEKLRHHSDINKKYREEDRALLLNIHSTLVGNSSNNNKGIVNLIEDIDTRVKHLESDYIEINVYKNQSKFVIGAVIVILMGILIQSIKNGILLDNTNSRIELRK